MIPSFRAAARRLANGWPKPPGTHPGLSGVGRTAFRFLTLTAVVLLAQSFLWSQSAPLVLKLSVVGLAVLSAIRPTEGILLVAGLTPFGRVIADDMFSAYPARFTEALVLTFLAGWLLHRFTHPDPDPPVEARVASDLLWLFAAVVVASLLVELFVLRHWKDYWWPFTQSLFRFLSQDYLCKNIGWYPWGPGMTGASVVGSAALMLEGLALTRAVHQLAGSNPAFCRRLARVLVFAAAGTAALSVFAALEVAIGAGLGPLAIVAGPRLAVHTLKVNTAASSFALFIPMAFGLLVSQPAVGRLVWSRLAGWVGPAVCVAVLFVALGLTGSRSAFVAILVAAVAVLVRSVAEAIRRRTSLRTAIGMLGVLGAVCLFLASGLYLRTLSRPEIQGSATVASLGGRVLAAQTSLQMLREHPLFGIGIGQYRAQSDRYAPDSQWRDVLGERFNAHDQFLQVAAELGLIGGGLFTAMLIVIVTRAWTVPWVGRNGLNGGVAAGLLAFLITSLTGQPLLVEVVAYPFWLSLGLALGVNAGPAADRGAMAGAGRWRTRLIAGALLVLACTLPLRAGQALDRVDFSAATYGMYAYQVGEDGRAFRLTNDWATFFLDTRARAFEIALRRHASTARGTLDAELFVDGRLARRFSLASSTWQKARFQIPPRSDRRPRRVDLRVTASGGTRQLVRVAFDVVRQD